MLVRATQITGRRASPNPVEESLGRKTFTEVKLRPHLKVFLEKDRDRANRLLEKAERTCLVARSITAKITFEPSINVVPEGVTAASKIA